MGDAGKWQEYWVWGVGTSAGLGVVVGAQGATAAGTLGE